MFHSSKKNLDSGPMSQKLFSVSRKHGGTFNLCFIHSKQGAYPSFRILNAKKVFILWGLLKWVSYAVCLLEHRPCMLHKTDILPSQGNLWSSRFSSHLSELWSWRSDAFVSRWKIHKSEGRKRLTSWLFPLLETQAQFIKGLLSQNMPVTPQHSCELSVSPSPLPFWFWEADAACGMWGIYEINGAVLGGLSFCWHRMVRWGWVHFCYKGPL